MKKGYCHIDGKVHTINFRPGSEIVCPTFWDSKNKSAICLTCQLYHYAFSNLKLAKFKIDTFLLEMLTTAHWIRLSLLCRCKWTRQSQVSYENVSEQYLFYEHQMVYCVYRKIYGVLSLSMEIYLCLWSFIFVYGVLSLYMKFYLCLWSSIFVYIYFFVHGI